jgi:hypothetical protein
MGNVHYLEQFTSRKKQTIQNESLSNISDSLGSWMARYIQLAVQGVRSEEVMKKVTLHLNRFLEFFEKSYGHDRISACLKRDIIAWQKEIRELGVHHQLSTTTSVLYRLLPVGSMVKISMSFR